MFAAPVVARDAEPVAHAPTRHDGALLVTTKGSTPPPPGTRRSSAKPTPRVHLRSQTSTRMTPTRWRWPPHLGGLQGASWRGRRPCRALVLLISAGGRRSRPPGSAIAPSPRFDGVGARRCGGCETGRARRPLDHTRDRAPDRAGTATPSPATRGAEGGTRGGARPSAAQAHRCGPMKGWVICCAVRRDG